ncbi:uncharacterized protein LOC133747743 [Lepus europaeus]|uniref:uncharacterized protein LOC133747743 n=1 Tax=Lepus europaeus TaxID=9983 RepID=UPI002B472B67|nr:uncharacterized protein LOC133747743 [Lepus europaeus]
MGFCFGRGSPQLPSVQSLRQRLQGRYLKRIFLFLFGHEFIQQNLSRAPASPPDSRIPLCVQRVHFRLTDPEWNSGVSGVSSGSPIAADRRSQKTLMLSSARGRALRPWFTPPHGHKRVGQSGSPEQELHSAPQGAGVQAPPGSLAGRTALGLPWAAGAPGGLLHLLCRGLWVPQAGCCTCCAATPAPSSPLSSVAAVSARACAAPASWAQETGESGGSRSARRQRHLRVEAVLWSAAPLPLCLPPPRYPSLTPGRFVSCPWSEALVDSALRAGACCSLCLRSSSTRGLAPWITSDALRTSAPSCQGFLSFALKIELSQVPRKLPSTHGCFVRSCMNQ